LAAKNSVEILKIISKHSQIVSIFGDDMKPLLDLLSRLVKNTGIFIHAVFNESVMQNLERVGLSGQESEPAFLLGV
jgi:hypothetical protein